MAARKPKQPPTPPDGQPAKPAIKRKDAENVSEVQDPLISGDEGKEKRVEADEAPVDNAGQIVKPDKDVDLLH